MSSRAFESSGREAALATARSRAYATFAGCFEYPDEELCELVRAGALARTLRAGLAAVDVGLADDLDAAALSDAGQGDALAVEFTRLFDVGASGPPCPLYGGTWGGARMKTMEETVRFYNHFGLTLSESPRELPDHLTTELEFLHFLTFHEAEALQCGEDPGSFRRAARDFVARHPGRWVPKLGRKLAAQDPLPFFRELVRQLERFLTHEERHLIAVAGTPPPDAAARA